MPTAYLGLGSNLGDRSANIRRALELLGERVTVERVSSLYETEPWGYERQPLFLNAVCRVSTALSPRRLLLLVKGTEKAMGRSPSFRNAPRPIDIDILLYENRTVAQPDLAIPHPRMLERAFVLVPLAEVAPELAHPEEGKTMRELASKTKDKQKVRPYIEPGLHPCQICRGDVKVNIHQMTVADYEQVWRLWHLCKVPVGSSFSREAVERLTHHDPELSLVAEVNGVIIGAIVGVLHGSQGRVCNHAVDIRCRGRGIGAKLFKEVERKLTAMGATEVEIMVPRDSLQGRKFFEDLGFKDDDRYEFMVKFYPPGK
ncbi:MAG: 2-amino-4-hydroxy-6-hydroxymethyldihydropteridine diphosphokinase [Chloroflexota bacterium]